MNKVKSVKLNSANVKYDNSVDTERVYDIEANANLNENKMVSMDGGVVRLEGVQKASFSYYGDNSKNISFNGISEEEECQVLSAINTFVASVKESVSVSPLNI